MKACDTIEFWSDPVIILVGAITVFYMFAWVMEKISNFIGYSDDWED
jgi:hypothetical protein